MHIQVLGSAAGGGFPQWNCNCANCTGVRQGRPGLAARTQSSICVSGDGENWILFNTSPDLLAQIKSFPPLQPARGLRDTGIAGIVLIDGQVDHTTGLLMLREGKPLKVHCTDCVNEDLSTGNPLFGVLSHFCGVERSRIPLEPGSSFTVAGAPGLALRAVALKSKAPPYSPHRDNPMEGDNIGVEVEDLRTGRRLFYAPGLAEIEPHLVPFMERADCIMLDGTFWTDEEMITLGVSKKRAREIGHLPQSGPGGMIESLRPFSQARRVLIHINNTNPILDEHSPERAALTAEGIQVAHDGMAIQL